MSYRYRKPSPHLDYSWSEEPTKEIGEIATQILQAHAESFASKTIAWFRVQNEGYLALCAQDKQMVDTAGRSCVFMIVTAASTPLSSKDCSLWMEQDWNPDSILEVPHFHPSDVSSDVQQELLHVLLSDGLIVVSNARVYDAVAACAPDMLLLYSPVKLSMYDFDGFGVLFHPKFSATRSETAQEYLDYNYPLSQLTHERLPEMWSFSQEEREFILGLLADYWTPEQHPGMCSEKIMAWLWHHWREHYIALSTAQMASFAIQKQNVQDSEIRNLLPKLASSSAQIVLDWLKEQEDGYELAVQHFPKREDIHHQIFPKHLKILWNALCEGETIEKTDTLSEDLALLKHFRDLLTIPISNLEKYYVLDGQLALAYKHALQKQGVDSVWLDDIFSDLPIAFLPEKPISYRLPHADLVAHFLVQNSVPHAKEWWAWWEAQQERDLYAKDVAYRDLHWCFALVMYDSEQMINVAVSWKDHLSEAQKNQLVAREQECSSNILEHLLGLSVQFSLVSLTEALLWENCWKNSIHASAIQQSMIQQAAAIGDVVTWRALGLSEHQASFCAGQKNVVVVSPWPEHLLSYVRAKMNSLEFWIGWNREHVNANQIWMESLDSYLSMLSLFSSESEINWEQDVEICISYPHVMSREQIAECLIFWKRRFDAPERNALVQTLLPYTPTSIRLWLESILCTPFSIAVPQSANIHDLILYLPLLSPQEGIRIVISMMAAGYPVEEKEMLIHSFFSLWGNHTFEAMPSPISGSIPEKCQHLMAEILQWQHWGPNIQGES